MTRTIIWPNRSSRETTHDGARCHGGRDVLCFFPAAFRAFSLAMPARASKGLLLCGLLVLASLPLTRPAAADPPPDSILGAPGSPPGSADYLARVDHAVAYDGSGSAVLKSTIKSPPRFGSLGQKVAGKVFAGKKIRFSAYVKTEKVRKIAGLWIRAEGAAGRVIAFKGAGSRGTGVSGTRNWTQLHIVVSVPKATAAVFIWRAARWSRDRLDRQRSVPRPRESRSGFPGSDIFRI